MKNPDRLRGNQLTQSLGGCEVLDLVAGVFPPQQGDDSANGGAPIKAARPDQERLGELPD